MTIQWEKSPSARRWVAKIKHPKAFVDAGYRVRYGATNGPDDPKYWASLAIAPRSNESPARTAAQGCSSWQAARAWVKRKVKEVAATYEQETP